jgi:formiminotetrahydrofolate cyclodeaminase
MALLDTPLRTLLDAFAASDPTPGGGSASALASATGASLLIMVAGLPKTRHGSDNDTQALSAAIPSLTALARQLAGAIDADAAAYDRVVAAYKLPKATADEQAARKAGIADALRAATDVPLTVMKMSADALQLARTVAAHGYASAASDVGVAIALLRAGLHGARLNVDVNLGGKDDPYASAARAEAERHSLRGAEAARSAEETLARIP